MNSNEILDSLKKLPVTTWVEKNYLYELVEKEKIKKKLELILVEKIIKLNRFANIARDQMLFVLMSSLHWGIKTKCICELIAGKADINYKFRYIEIALRTLAQTKYIGPRMRAWFSLGIVLPSFINESISNKYLVEIGFPDNNDVLSLMQKRLDIAQKGPDKVKSWALTVLMPGLLKNGCNDMCQKIRKVVEEFCPPPKEFIP